jgi:hypothetical protein
MRTIYLKDAAARYLMSQGKIKQGTDPDNMDDNWKFIMGDTRKLSIKDVKARMNKGGNSLNLIKFSISNS